MTPAIVLFVLRLLLVATAYAFLTGLLIVLWQDIRTARTATELSPPAHLLVLDGPGAAGVHTLAEVNLLGRAHDNSICLDDRTVSAYHARLAFRSGQWWLEDLGSRNGTHLNDLAVVEPLVITYGDEIALGKVKLVLKAGHSEAAGNNPAITLPEQDRDAGPQT